MKIFDTHAHYDDKAFDEDREELLTEVLPSKDVKLILTAGTNLFSSLRSQKLAKKYPYIYFAAGIHPEDIDDADESDLEIVEDILTRDEKGVAVGEIGLDYHCDTDKNLQKFFFEKQLILANKLNLPVVIHDREAHGDTMDLIRKYKPKGTLHCFSGSAEMAKELVDLGLFIGCTGNVTFKGNKKALRVIEEVPAERLLVETDCPYMAPVPLRGNRSDSSMISYTLEFMANIKGVSAEEMSLITYQNACSLFSIKE